MPKDYSNFSFQPYSILSADDLQCQADESVKNITFTGSTTSCNSTVQSCPLAPKNQNTLPENKNCTFTGVKASKSNRKFDYAWNKTEGVVKDGNNDLENLYEIVSGDTKISEVSIEKIGLAGPCTEQKHKGKSWDIEGYPSLPDNKINVKLPVPKLKNTDFQNYLSVNYPGKSYSIGAIKCSGSQTFIIKCYPDTEFKLSGSFTLIEGSFGQTTYTDESKSKIGSKGELNVEIKRNGAQAFKVNLLEYENSGKTEKTKFDENTSDSYNLVKFLKIIPELKQKWQNFSEVKDKIFTVFNKSSNNKISFKIVFFKAQVDVTAKWIEIAASRYCDFQFLGTIKLAPILSIDVDFDFTNLVTNIPYFGTALALVDAFLETFKIGDLFIKLAIKGQVGLTADAIDIRTRNVYDKYKNQEIYLTGEIGVTLKACAQGNINIDVWRIHCGGEAKAEAGIKAKFADTETIYKEIKDYVLKRQNKDEIKELSGLEDPATRKSNLYFSGGKLFVKAKIGFSGLIIYTIAYAQGSCSITTYKKTTKPSSFNQPVGEGSVLTTESQKNQTASGGQKKWGSEEEKIQAVIWADPLIWSPDINIFGN
jgi:hypothetical protein